MYTLYHNARIYSLTQQNKVCSALVTRGDKIVFTGELNEINLPEHELKKIDLRGRTVVPGFIDCHTHIGAVALSGERLKLDNCGNLAEAQQQIKRQLQTFSEEHWILGGGWNANIWPEGLPHKNDLDLLSSERPIALYNKDGHTMWLNSKALHVAGFDRSTPDPVGGKLGRDSGGELNGLVFETACFQVDQKTDPVSYDFLNRCLTKYYPVLFRLGITSVHSCESLAFYHIFQQLAQKARLQIRICMHPPMAEADTIIQDRKRSGAGDEWLRLGGLKYFVDGSLGSQTAEMFEPYEILGHTGISILGEAELSERLLHAARHGLSATVHAIGDKANHKALNAFSRTKDVSAGLRHRIEHAQIILPEDRQRYHTLDIIASMQPMHIADDIQIADKYLGARTANTYAINALIRDQVRVVFGSDMPVADPDPLKGMLSAVSRRYKLDRNLPAWHPEHCVSPLQALRCYTAEAAYASYEEDLKGTLEAGKLADFVVLSDDFIEGCEEAFYKTRVTMTVLNGKIVYRADD